MLYCFHCVYGINSMTAQQPCKKSGIRTYGTTSLISNVFCAENVFCKKSIQQVYATHKFIVSCDNRWACHFYFFCLFEVKTRHVRCEVYTFVSGEECYTTVIKPFGDPQIYAIIVSGLQFCTTSTTFFISWLVVILQFGRLFARTVPKHLIPCSWIVFTRSTLVYLLSK